jgi:hypothetical protein
MASKRELLQQQSSLKDSIYCRIIGAATQGRPYDMLKPIKQSVVYCESGLSLSDKRAVWVYTEPG